MGQVAPEIADEMGEETAQSIQQVDVFPLGIMLYVMCEGALPYKTGEYMTPTAFLETFAKENEKKDSHFVELVKFMISKKIDLEGKKLRWNLEEVKSSKWYNQPTLSNE